MLRISGGKTVGLLAGAAFAIPLLQPRARSRIIERFDGVWTRLGPPARRSNTPGSIAASRRRQTRPTTRQLRSRILERALNEALTGAGEKTVIADILHSVAANPPGPVEWSDRREVAVMPFRSAGCGRGWHPARGRSPGRRPASNCVKRGLCNDDLWQGAALSATVCSRPSCLSHAKRGSWSPVSRSVDQTMTKGWGCDPAAIVSARP